jgi:hypothetical protein
MKELFVSAWDMLIFRPHAYEQHAARPDVFKAGLLLLLVVTLVAGALSFAIGLVNDLIPARVDAQREETRAWIENPLERLGPLGRDIDLPPEFRRQMPDILAGLEIGLGIDELKTPLPRPIGRVLSNVGTFLSSPLSRLAGWMGYTLWVLLAAKLLGGRSTLPRMLGTTAVYSVPHVLGVLGFVPCLGGLLALVSLGWGIAIYVKAVSAANEFSIGRAVAATALPIIALIVLTLPLALIPIIGALVNA